MTRVLILSSWVAHGHVGLCAAAPVLQALGNRVTQLPTTVLSNHPGWPHKAGQPVPCDQIRAMIDALDENGWLHEHDTVLTGYLPSADHVSLAAELVARMCVRRPAPRVIVDPILGDTPTGIYIDEAAANALRDRLLPFADVVTPNAFELGWLTGLPVDTLDALRRAAKTLLRSVPVQDILTTSAPAPSGQIGTVSISRHAELFWSTQRRNGVPNGAGDVFSALVASGLPTGAALGHLAALIEASAGAPHLCIAESAARWKTAPPIHHKSLARS